MKAIRTIYKTKRILNPPTFVCHTSRPETEIEMELAEHGYDDYLEKPCMPE
jgi:DNA-binding response OmpR family regulator